MWELTQGKGLETGERARERKRIIHGLVGWWIDNTAVQKNI
jgi:hypothetical protein